MAKLCDIVKPGVPCKITKHGNPFTWDGNQLFHYSKLGKNTFRNPVVATDCVVFDTDWQLDEPTVESVLRERGYTLQPTFVGDPAVESVYIGCGEARLFRAPASKMTVPLATAICDLLDKFK